MLVSFMTIWIWLLLREIRTCFLDSPLVVIWIFFLLGDGKTALWICRIFLLGRAEKASLMYKTFLASFATCANVFCLLLSFWIALWDLAIVSLFGCEGIGGGIHLILLWLFRLVEDFSGELWGSANWCLTISPRDELLIMPMESQPDSNVVSINSHATCPKGISWVGKLPLFSPRFLCLRKVVMWERERMMFRMSPSRNLLVPNREIEPKFPSQRLGSAGLFEL